MKNQFYIKTYTKMTFGLLITTIVAYFGYISLINNPINGFIYNFIYGVGPLFIFVAQIVIAMIMGFLINKMNQLTANLCFITYSVLTGLTLSTVPVMYGMDTMFVAAGFTALLFIILTVFGLTTKIDLSKWGTVLFAGLITLLIMGLIGFFWHNPLFFKIYNYLGVIIFIAYVAYDSQMLKYYDHSDSEVSNKYSTLAALNLYLDAINLFFKLLNIIESDN